MHSPPPPVRFSDTLAPVDLVARHGYYRVGDRCFSNKVLALQEATRTRQEVNWHFNDAVFCQQDWRSSLPISLADLYRERAQQLRDKYDYLVLCWSGGADSTTVLDSFLRNDIRLDEVVVLWPLTKSQGKYQPSRSIKSTNMMSEWDYSLRPRLDRLQNSHPEIRITIGDMLTNLSHDEDREDTIRMAEKHNYCTIQRCRVLDGIMRDRSDRYNQVAAIFGVGPVELVILDEWLTVEFGDTMSHALSTTDVTAEGWLRNIEYFYWTPDMPEIVKQQAHAMADHLDRCPQDRQYWSYYSLDRNGVRRVLRKANDEMVRTIRRSVIYDTWDHSILQVNKARDTHFHHDNFHWFYADPHSLAYTRSWESHLRSQQALIDPKFYRMRDGVISGYQPIAARPYPVRRLTPAA